MTNLEARIREYREYQRMKEEAEATMDALKLEIIAAMGEAEEVVAGEYKARYKAITSSRFDSTAFKATHADLYRQYYKESTSRRFSIA